MIKCHVSKSIYAQAVSELESTGPQPDAHGVTEAQDAVAARFPLSTLGQLAALSAALLPATGVLIRVIAFAFEPRFATSTIDLSTAEPIASLAFLGLLPVIIVSCLPLLEVLEARTKKLEKYKRVMAIVVGLILLLAAPFPILVALPVAFVLGGRTTRRILRRGEVGFSRVWPVLLPVFGAAVFIGGCLFVHLSSGYVTMAKAGGARNGSYSIVGTSGSLTYLLPCQTNRPLIAVNTAVVDSVTFYKHPSGFGPSLLTWAIEGHPIRLGVTYSCSR
jgi:hypothetical protein